MWFFGSDDDDGCGAHHFDEYTETDETRVEDRIYRWDSDGEYKGWCLYSDIEDLRERNGYLLDTAIVQVKLVKECQHHGCTETKTRWETRRVIPKDDLLENIGITKEEMKEKYGPEQEEDDG